MDKILIKCDFCGKTFYQKRSQVKRSKKHYCSFTCRCNGQKSDPIKRKKKVAEYNKKWNSLPQNKAHRQEYNKVYRSKNIESISATQNRWRKNHKEELRIAAKKRYYKDLEKSRSKNNERQRLWTKNNPDKALLQRIKYYTNNDHAKITQRLYQEKKKAQQYGCYIGDQNNLRDIYSKILLADEIICYYCGESCGRIVVGYGKNATVDHKIPLCRTGDHDVSNIVACCRRCNSLKGSKTEEEYVLYKEKINKLLSSQ
jgi:hypothetical protein